MSSAESMLDHIPCFCAHEHWGSINALGASEEGFRADLECGAQTIRGASIWDLVLDPYFGGWLAASGVDATGLARQAGHENVLSWWRDHPGQALDALFAAMAPHATTGAFQCVRRGVMLLHNADISIPDLSTWRKADESTAKAYSDLPAWHQNAMKQLGISALIRPVHPEYFFHEGPDAAAERAYAAPILRIDPLLACWPKDCPRRDCLAEAVGVDPRDAASWRAFIERLFDLAAERGNIGVKQLQAYSRPLLFEEVRDEDAAFVGELSPPEQRAFQNWIMHECCRQAHERGWPHQVHVGTHNLSQSSPLPLEGLARRYPRMKLVLLHCWPFLEESAYLAKHLPNVYLDACWQTILNPSFFAKAMEHWIGYLPGGKIMCSQDATSVEMAAGSAFFARQLLEAALRQWMRDCGGSAKEALLFAEEMLHNAAARVYNRGNSFASCSQNE